MDNYSIINKKNILAREIMSNIIQKLKDKYNEFLILKEKLSPEIIFSIKIDISSKMLKNIQKENQLKKKKQLF